jgi:hypothetical protein
MDKKLKYFTHQPFLIKTLEQLDYSQPTYILEMGTGEGFG